MQTGCWLALHAASGVVVGRSTRSLACTVMSTPERDEKPKRLSDGDRTFFFVFGIYLVVGAAYTFATGRWFIGFPPQLDIAYLLGGSSSVAAYVEAAIAAVLGGGCLYMAFSKERANSAS
jgi:hypothetical protein